MPWLSTRGPGGPGMEGDMTVGMKIWRVIRIAVPTATAIYVLTSWLLTDFKLSMTEIQASVVVLLLSLTVLAYELEAGVKRQSSYRNDNA